jgi:hypothetical protein
LVDFINYSLEKSNSRCYGVNVVPLVDVFRFLQGGVDAAVSDDDESDEISTTKEENLHDSMDEIVLSDSSDDSDDEDVDVEGKDIVSGTTAMMPQPTVFKPIAAVAFDPIAVAVADAVDKRKALFELAKRRPMTSRAALLTNLRMKAQQTARENYCAQVHLHTEELAARLEISERCR